METAEEFKRNSTKIFVDEFLEALKPFEEERKAVLKKCNKFTALCVLWCLINIPLFFALRAFSQSLIVAGFDDAAGLAVGIISIADGCIALWLGMVPSWEAKGFEKKMKKQVMPLLFKNSQGFKWIEKSGLKTEQIHKFNLFMDFYSREDDDNFCGIYKGVKIEICETKLSQASRSVSPFFKGVLIQLSMEKPYNGMTLIKQKERQRIDEPLARALKAVENRQKFQKVNLEDVEFAKKFHVFSTDQIEARYTLTTSFMDRFKNIAFAFDASNIEASFCENYLLVALSTEKDLFKLGSLSKPVFDFRQFNIMIEEFASVLELIDELKLNQKIGL